MNEAAAPLVLHVIHQLRMGGMENGLVNLINRMPRDRYRHAIACVEDDSEFRLRIRRPDVDVFPLHRSKVGVWGVQRRIHALCTRLRPEIVHSRNPSGLDALLPARLAGVTVRLHGEHGWDVVDIDGRAWKPALLRRLHAPLVSHYVTVSKDLERYLVARVGIRPDRITQIYNGVDTERFSPPPKPARDLLPEAFRSDNAVVVGLVGRLSAVKDYGLMLRGLAMLLERSPEAGRSVRLAFFGAGPTLDELRRLARDLGVDAQVWFAGAVEDVPGALRAVDVFALTSLNEGISNTILEAMATGLPVLATAVGGNVELVVPGVTGTLVPPSDPGALADALAAYAADPALRRRHGAAGRARAVAEFGMATMVTRYLDLYDASLKRLGPRRGDATSRHRRGASGSGSPAIRP